MSNETIAIYSAINLDHKEVIPKTAKETYLNCKFWKATRDDAIKFSQVYRGPVRYEAYRTIALLNNQSLSHQNIQSLHHTIAWLITSGGMVPQNLFVMLTWVYLNIAYCLNQLWVDIHNDQSYPNECLIEDVVLWAAQKNLINGEQKKHLRKKY